MNSCHQERALWEVTITEIMAGYYEPDEHGRRAPESLYGRLKMWAHLRRQGIEVARCTVERIILANGWRGVTRTKRIVVRGVLVRVTLLMPSWAISRSTVHRATSCSRLRS